MNYEEWVAAGKDPDDFKGKKAYEAEYNRIQDNKELKSEVGGLKEMLQEVVKTAEENRARDRQEMQEKFEKELKEAKDNMDVDGAIEAQRKLDGLKKEPEAPKINPVITDFLSSNPLLDKNSSQFNEDFMADYEAIHNSKVDLLTSNGTRPISDAQLKKAMKSALAEAKNLNPDLFKSQRTTRQTPGKSQPGSTQTKNLSDYKIDDQSDPRNQNAANDIYEMLKNKDPKMAEKFKENLLGD